MPTEHRCRYGPTWIFIVMGVVLVLTGVIVRAIGNSRPAVVQAQAPSVASRLQDLARLHRQGLISEEEFDAKRAELIEKLYRPGREPGLFVLPRPLRLDPPCGL